MGYLISTHTSPEFTLGALRPAHARGPKITLGGAAPPRTPLAEKYSCLKSVLDPVYIRVKLQPSSSNTFRDMRGSQIYTRGRCTPRTPLRENFFML